MKTMNKDRQKCILVWTNNLRNRPKKEAQPKDDDYLRFEKLLNENV